MTFASRFVALAALLTLMAGCAARRAIHPPDHAAPLASAHLTHVPFFPNNTDQCGPTSLASVLNYWSVTVSSDELRSEIYLGKIKGTLPMDMAAAVERRGLSANVFNGTFEDVKRELRAGRPVIAYLDFGTRRHPIGHFLVVTGFDDERGGLYVHSATRKDRFASYRRFNRGWSDTERWMMTVGPSGEKISDAAGAAAIDAKSIRPSAQFRLALSAREYFELGQAYEHQGLENEALSAYRSALYRDDSFEPALLALGNAAFAAGDLREAERCFKRVLKKNPAHGAANNNLAMVYLTERRNLDRAAALARKALATDAKPYAEDTLAQIERAR